MEPTSTQLWNQVLERLSQQLSPPTFETWIQPTSVQEWKADSLLICAPNPFVLNHLQKHYLNTITATVREIVGYPLEIRLTTIQGESMAMPIANRPSSNRSNANREEMTFSSEGLQPKELNSRYIFSRFVVGPTNRMAHAAALAVAESPGREFNPLFLCGGVGLGKTHLMQAIAHYRLETYPDSRVFYVSTEQFTNDLITAIRKDSIQSFRDHYRAADVLLVDDIQFIESKEYTQEEFFHTFNTLHQAGKQVVLASDRPPNKIPTLQNRLSSRFSMGLIADIQVPDLETRMAILQKKAEYENIRLPRSVIEYIASHYTSNIRELEGALIRAVAYIAISGQSMTVENIAPVLNPPTERVMADPSTILETVASYFNLAVEDLKSNSRRREISTARQIGFFLMRQHTDLSLPRIGDVFGGKDHTTVMYGCDKIAQRIKKEPDLNQVLTKISDLINLNSKPST